jgi:hypothetical protein
VKGDEVGSGRYVAQTKHKAKQKLKQSNGFVGLDGELGDMPELDSDLMSILDSIQF